MSRTGLSAAILAAGFLMFPTGAFTGVAHADEVTDLKAEAKALQQKNEALAKRLAAIEQRQKELDASVAANRQRALNANAADIGLMPTKAVPYTSPDDSLCWHGVCMYGIVDMGFGYQTHGAPFNGSFTPGDAYVVMKNSNRGMFLASPNALSQSTIGLKGETEILPGLKALFKIDTGFDPMSGQLANSPGSFVQNNGVALATQTANGDSSRAGQALNGQALVGVSSPLYGTLTVGRQNTLTLDQILAYDPMGGSYAFSPLGFNGAFGGGGVTQDGRLDQSIKYRWEYGPVHAGAMYQVGNYGNSGNSMWPHDAVQADIGASYLGFSVDGTFSKIRGAVSTALLGTTANFLGNQTLAATISDNTSFMATAKYKIDRFEILGGYEHIQFANPQNPATAGFTDIGGYVMSVVNNAAFPNDKIIQMMWIGGKYQATSNLTVIGTYYHEIQNAFGTGALAGCHTNFSGFCSGSGDMASLVLDYTFNKHFDVYGGIMYSKFNGGLASGFLNSWNADPTVGARYTF